MPHANAKPLVDHTCLSMDVSLAGHAGLSRKRLCRPCHDRPMLTWRSYWAGTPGPDLTRLPHEAEEPRWACVRCCLV